MRTRENITEQAILDLLTELDSPWGPTLQLEFMKWNGDQSGIRADCRVLLRWEDASYEFVAELKSRSSPREVEQAAYKAKQFAEASGLLPMVVVPFLDECRLEMLASESVSGIDLSGNGIVIVPGKVLLRRSGQPNRYPDSQPTKYAYRGATSIVPRVFLCQPEFESVGAIKEEIEARGASVALSTVSKALARMMDDILIERRDSRITLLQPELLLDKLRENFTAPSGRREVRLKAANGLGSLFEQLNRSGPRPQLVLSGASSQSQYSAGLRSDEPVAYCRSLTVLERASSGWEETERFADLTVIETGERTPFFDTRRESSGLTFASPIQSYLELAVGDKREREMAQQVRTEILRDVASSSERVER